MTAGVHHAPASAARVHPILGYRRLHTGVDYAAPRGTPILAAGNGVVEKAGRSSGYGNLIDHPAHQRLRDRLRPPVGASPRASRRARASARARSSAMSARPASRPARTFTSRSGSTASRSIRSASACRAAACSRATSSPPSSTSASASTRCSASSSRRADDGRKHRTGRVGAAAPNRKARLAPGLRQSGESLLTPPCRVRSSLPCRR